MQMNRLQSEELENERLIAAVIFESKNAIMITDANNLIIRVNESFTTITGYKIEDVIGKSPRILSSGREHQSFYRAMWARINKTGSWEGDISNRRKDGLIYLERLFISAVKDSNGVILNYVSIFYDITTIKKAATEIQRLAFYDPLTGLANRLLLRDRLKQALIISKRNGTEGALLFIDLDNFKILNDTKGHDIGDLLLKQVAQRLESCIRRCDTVARFGGDEFVIILEELSKHRNEVEEQAEIVGLKILAAFKNDYQLDSHSYKCTPSIGITIFNGCEQSIDDPMKQADIAMYQAKELGRNKICFFNSQMQININARIELEKELHTALIENQFQLFYQSQVKNTGEVVGAEALIRWQHPQRGLLHPIEFILLAEKSELIIAIGLWVLKHACIQLKHWESQPKTQALQLSVNISAKHFGQDGFVNQVIEIISFYSIRADRLKIEIVESLLIENIEESIDKMNELRAIGVRFSIDDFGTGYSSLSYLTRLPLDQLKIDKSFVRHIGHQPFNGVIVQTVIGMAESLGIEVIAEGVETEMQRAFLEENNCCLYQGYLFSKPVSIEAFVFDE
jgi:diguanylate cyclase (GGDEF)-like protein/PAS domain S-box-containing protein